MNSSFSSISSAPESGLVSGDEKSKTLEDTLSNCLSKYIPSSQDTSTNMRKLVNRRIESMKTHCFCHDPKIQLIDNQCMSAVIERINMFFSENKKVFDLERCAKNNDRYWSMVGIEPHLSAKQQHYDISTSNNMNFLKKVLPQDIHIEENPIHFRHLKSITAALSDPFFLLDKACAIIILNGTVTDPKDPMPHFQSHGFMIAWEKTGSQRNSSFYALLFDGGIEQRWKKKPLETHPSFLKDFIHDVYEHAGMLIKGEGLVDEEIRMILLHKRPDYPALVALD